MQFRLDPEQKLKLCMLLEEAAAQLLFFYCKPIKIHQKEDMSPVTEADLASNTIMDKGLQELTPGIPIVSEENILVPFSIRKNWQAYWVLDPLDGTLDFLAQTDEFCICLALIVDGEVVLSAIHDPIKGISYIAQKGEGVVQKELAKELQAFDKPKVMSTQSIMLISRQSRSLQLRSFAKQQNLAVLPFGSALKFIKLLEANGEVLIRLRPSAIWDIAPGVCFLTELGGQLLSIDQVPLSFKPKESIIYPPFAAFLYPEKMEQLWQPLNLFLEN